MRFTIEKLSPSEWMKLSASANLIAFGERFDPEMDRIDYALLVVDKDNTPAGYMTVKEMDGETAYIQHGGAFPDHAKTVHVVKQYEACINLLRTKYSVLTTKIENINTPMLKMALRAGFVITGVNHSFPKLFLELTTGGV